MAQKQEVDALARQIGNMSVSEDTTRRSVSYISLRDAAETILPFDGKNMPVSQFTNSCLHAKDMVSPGAEYGLVQMIKNKLVGPALRVALSGEYNDVESLLAVIKTRFAPVYSSSQLHGELSKVTQHPDESVVDYGSRVSMILQQLKSCYQTENPIQAVQFTSSAEVNAIKNFLTGLKTDIYTRLYSREPIDLNHAIESAIKAEAEYNEHAQRMKITEGLIQSIRCNNCLGYGHNSYSCSTINPLAQVTHVQWQPKICTFCKNSGHTRAECRALQPRNLNQRNIPLNNMNKNINYNNNRANRQNFGTFKNNNLMCHYCKNLGHSIEQCRKRQYNNNPRNQMTRFNNQETRIRENQGNRERAQRNGAALNERPRVRLVNPEQTHEDAQE